MERTLSSPLSSPVGHKSIVNVNFDVKYCIICQKDNVENLTSTENGRKRIMEAAEIRKDDVKERLRSILIKADFKYHMTNECYKRYTHKKVLSRLLDFNEDDLQEPRDESRSSTLEPDAKRTRSASTARSGPSQQVNPDKLICVICGKRQSNGITKKYRISENLRATNLRKAASILMDDVYTRISDLDTDERMFSADIYYHNSCFPAYITKATRVELQAKNVDCLRTTKRDVFKNYTHLVKQVIDQGRGLSLSDIRDMINTDLPDADLKNNEIKLFLSEEFDDLIQFCEPERKNQSLFVFSSSISVVDVANTLRSMDNIKTAALEIRKALLGVDFGLDDKFCDAEELKTSWKNTHVPDILLSFFAGLLNKSVSSLIKTDFDDKSDDHFSDPIEDSEDDVSLKIKSLFQILYYHVTHGRQKTPLHLINAHAIYEHCKSKELITAFNKQSCCVSYNVMKQHRADLAKYHICSSSDGVPLPSNFSPTFTIGAFDNFDLADKNSLSGLKHTHDTAIILCPETPQSKMCKPSKSSVNLKDIEKVDKLPCQKIRNFYPAQKLPPAESFKVDEGLFNSPEVVDSHKKIEFMISCMQNVPQKQKFKSPTWAGIRSLINC